MYKLIFLGLVATAILGYFTYSQSKINTLTKTNAELTSSLNSYIEANNILRSSINRQVQLLEDARRANVIAERKASEALEALEDSNLNQLSQQKPELIEKIINKGTKDVLNQIESITSQ